jgi:hypothetical protein
MSRPGLVSQCKLTGKMKHTFVYLFPYCDQILRTRDVSADAEHRRRLRWSGGVCRQQSFAFSTHRVQFSAPARDHAYLGASCCISISKRATDATGSPQNQDPLHAGRDDRRAARSPSPLGKPVEEGPGWSKDTQSDGSGGTNGINHAHCVVLSILRARATQPNWMFG